VNGKVGIAFLQCWTTTLLVLDRSKSLRFHKG
jgi:hypothetical protein